MEPEAERGKAGFSPRHFKGSAVQSQQHLDVNEHLELPEFSEAHRLVARPIWNQASGQQILLGCKCNQSSPGECSTKSSAEFEATLSFAPGAPNLWAENWYLLLDQRQR